MDLASVTVEGAAPAAAPPPPEAGAAAPAPEPVRAYQPIPGMAKVTEADGTTSLVRVEDLPAVVAEGAHPTTQAEQYAEEQGWKGQVGAALSGAARGATFGLSDAATVAIDGESAREAMRLEREAYPGTSTVAEIGGSLLPLALGAPPGGAAVEGTGLLARAGARFAATAPRAFLEGALISGGNQLTEDVLGDHELVASKYLAKGLEGGILGALVGGTLHAGAGLVGDALAGRAAAKGASGLVEGAPYRTAGSVDAAAGRSTSVSERLSALAEEQAAKGALHSASMFGTEIQKLAKTSDAQMSRLRRIGRTLLDEGITTPGATKAIQAERLTAKVEQIGRELGQQRQALEKSVVRPSAENILARINSEVVGPLQATPFTSDVQRAIEPFVEEIQQRAGGKSLFRSFADLFSLRDGLDKKLQWHKGIPPPTPALKELRAIRRIMEDEVESAAEHAAADLGENVAQKYRVTKALFSDLKTAEGWAMKSAARETQNRAISLTDTIMAGAALASGHPWAVLAPAANKAARMFGNQVAATTLDRVSRLQILQRSAQEFDGKLAASVKSYFAGGEKKAAGKAARAAGTVSPAARAALRDAVSNPAALGERVASRVASTGLRDAAPKVSDAAVATVMRAAGYVRDRLPPEPKPAGLVLGPQRPRPLGIRDQATLDNAVRALDVDKTLDDLARGRLDRHAWEAIRIINPPLHAEMVKAVQSYAVEHRPELDRQQLVAMSIITGTPLTPYMEPQTIQGLQQAYAEEGPGGETQAPDEQGAPPPQQFGGGSVAPSRRARSFASASDKAEAGED